MRVIICEDDHVQKNRLNKEIMDYANFHEPSIEVVLCASQPDEVLTYLGRYQADCYFLDIELNHQLNGMELAMEIRKKDPIATIIFITTHADRLKLTFAYKLAALDFIIKETTEQISSEVKEVLQVAFKKYKQLGEFDQSTRVQLQIGERIQNVNIQDIYYIETSTKPHKLALYEKHGYYEFYGKLIDFEGLDTSFYRCHKSYVINLYHVNELHKTERRVVMSNGAVCTVSFRLVRELQRKLAAVSKDRRIENE